MKTKVRRKLFLLLTVAGISTFSSAQNDRVPCIQIFTGEDSKPSHEYALDDMRKIFFGADDFTIQFHQVSNEHFNLDAVRCIRFDLGDPSSIESAQNDPEKAVLAYNGQALVVNGCKRPADLRVYDLTGRLLLTAKVQHEAEVSTAQLEAGIYLAALNHQTLKFIKQ